ncbi:DMT family transporter [Roseibium aestuarii]|uniref:DMT family transporter n=1 Tax=Roseibium aestuarii TaxID=2600299 RepID=A0ABW4JVZ6_9HYPH|nr:EamA family transporter [Roseibium aestuarii]
MSLLNWLMLLFLGSIWGGSFVVAKVAVAEIPPLVLVFLRVLLAGAVLHLVLRARGLRFPTDRRTLRDFAVMGLLNNAIPFSLLFLGQTAISASLASILNATTPIFAFLVAALWLGHEPVRLHRIAGVLVGLGGIAVLLSSSLTGLAHDPVWAQLACLGAAVSYGLSASWGRRFRGMPPLVTATGQMTASTVIMAPVALISGLSWTPLETSLTAWGCVLALALIATAFAYLLFFRVLASAGATNASVVTMIVPAVAVILGALLLGESLTLTQTGGLGLLLAGLVVLDGRLFTRKTPVPTSLGA